MNNAFHEIELAVEQNKAGTSDAVRALLASVHLESCMECSSRFRSEEFLITFRNLLRNLKLCHDLVAETNEIVSGIPHL
jgi:hypothetical protein